MRKQALKQVSIVVALILLIIPLLIQHDYDVFFRHPFVKTDFHWKQPEVDCIKGWIEGENEIQFVSLENGNISKVDVYTHYTYQYMFVPIILKTSIDEMDEKFIAFNPDGDLTAFKEYQIISCSGNLYFLRK